MSKKYICDACLRVIDDPWKVNMKEFYVGLSIGDFGEAFPCKTKSRQKIHMCGDCYSNFLKYSRTGVLDRKERT